MRVSVFGIDITGYLANSGGEAGQVTGLGTLVPQRQFRILNPPEELKALVQTSWKDQEVIVEDSGEIIYSGQIIDIAESLDGAYVMTLTTRDTLGVRLNVIIEDNDKASYSGFTVAQNTPAGATTIQLSGTKFIPKNTVVYFAGKPVPTYLITGSSGVPTTEITIDRGLERDLTAGDTVTISAATKKSAARAIIDALTAAGAQKIGESIEALAAEDTAAGRLLWINIRKEDEINLGSHISTLTNMGLLNVWTDSQGYVQARRTIASSSAPYQTITELEAIEPVSSGRDDTYLTYAANCAYYDGSAAGYISKTVSDQIVNKYKNRSAWTPIELQSESILSAKYLYLNASVAEFYADLKLAVDGIPRRKVQLSITEQDQIGRQYQVGMFTDLNMSLSTRMSQDVEGTYTITQYKYNPQQKTYQLTVETTLEPVDIDAILNNYTPQGDDEMITGEIKVLSQILPTSASHPYKYWHEPDTTISDANAPDWVAMARARRMAYIPDSGTPDYELDGASRTISSNVATLTFSDTAKNNKFLEELSESFQDFGGTWADFAMVINLPSAVGDIPAGDYNITGMSVASRTISMLVTAPDNSGSVAFVASLYPHRIVGSTTTAKWRQKLGKAIYSAGGDIVAGGSHRGRFQGFAPEYGSGGTGDGVTLSSYSSGGYSIPWQSASGSAQNGFWSLVSDGTNGTPITGKTTRAAGVGEFIAEFLGAYTP